MNVGISTVISKTTEQLSASLVFIFFTLSMERMMELVLLHIQEGFRDNLL